MYGKISNVIGMFLGIFYIFDLLIISTYPEI